MNQSVGHSLAQLLKLNIIWDKILNVFKTEWAQAHSLERITEIPSSSALRNFAADWF